MTVIEDDQTLLRRFMSQGDRSAFEAIVNRHISLVFAAALRQVGDRHLAEDVAQSVFLVLWQKAHRINADAVLAGWLFNTTRYAAANAVKMENRRRHHERGGSREEAMEPGAQGDELRPILDRGLAKLAGADRDALLLRFFEARSLGEVGLAMGLSEEAARKRVSRGLEKLRVYFRGEGVTLSAVGLGESLARFGAAGAAPAHLPGMITAAVSGGSAAASVASAAIAKATVMTMFVAKFTTAAVVGLILAIGVLAVTPVVRHEMRAAAFTLAATQPTTSPVIVAQQQISGRVVGADGKPVGAAEVYFISRDNEGVGATETAADGTFSAKMPVGILANQSEVFAQVPNVGISPQSPLGTEPVQLQLARAVSVQVPFLAPGGKPASNLRLRLSTVLFQNDAVRFPGLKFVSLTAEAAKAWETSTDGGGKCVIHGLPAGSQVGLLIDDDRYAQLGYTDRFRLQDKGLTFAAPIQLYKAASIIGTIEDPATHQSVLGVGVYASSTDSDSWASATSDQDGHYELKRLKPEKFRISVLWRGKQPLQRTAASKYMSVSEGQTQRLDFQFCRGGIISGTVRDKVTGNPLPGLAIGLFGVLDMQDYEPGTNTDDHGKYTLRTAPGKRTVYIAQSSVDGYLPISQRGNETYVVEGQTYTVNFELVPTRSLGVTGIVHSAGGQVATGATVLCMGPKGGLIEMEKSTKADAEGRFHFASVAPDSMLRARWKDLATETAVKIGSNGGDYSLTVSDKGRFDLIVEVTDDGGIGIPGASASLTTWSGTGGEGGQPHLLDPETKTRFTSIYTDMRYSIEAQAPGYAEAHAQVVPKPGIKEKMVTLILREETSEIAGTVVDVAGHPMPNVTVRLSGSQTGSRSTRTDAAGRFRFSVAPGVRAAVSLKDGGPQATWLYGKAGQTDLKLRVGR